MKNVVLILATMLLGCTQTTSNPPITAAPPAENQIMCTQDAKQCPDGRWVGRSGPKCEFICN